MAQTKLANLIDPEVFSDLISAELPNAIRFAPLATVNRELVGQPGSTLNFPAWVYIGAAEDVAEGEPIPLDEMSQTQKGVQVKKAAEKAVEEAAKLAKMNEEEKREFEYQKLQEELAELKRKDAYYGLSREASKMLAEHDIQANDDLLQFVVKDDAEGTQAAINAFVELFNAKVEQGVQKALSGRTPKANVNANQVVTQEQFNKMGYSERVALKQKDENLYNKLKGE